MFRRTVLLTAVLAMASTSAFAQGAKVSSAQGAVYANRGGQMTPVKAGSVLQSGDRIVAAGGNARITFSDGCNVSVTARSMVTVGDASPCVGGSSSLIRVQDSDNGEGGYGADEGGWDFWTWATFGVITVGTTAVVINDDSDPSSPQ